MSILFRGHRVEVTFRANAVRLTLRVQPEQQTIRLTAPVGCDGEQLRAFLARHADWIEEQLRAAVPAPDAAAPSALMPGGELLYNGYRVRVTVRSNARRLLLHHRPHEDFFSMTVPVGCSRQLAMEMLAKNEDWMRKHMAQTPALDWQPVYAAGERHPVLGELVTLGKNGVPCGKAAFLRYRMEQLRQLLGSELKRWQLIMGVRVTKVTIRSMRSRWGSCKPSTGAVTFAAELGCYPPECVTETVVHELTHLHHADHSAAFYAEMTRYFPAWEKAKERRRRFDITPKQPE